MRCSTIVLESRVHPKNATCGYSAFLIDGSPLIEQIHRAGYDFVDCIEPIGWTNEDCQRDYAERLLLYRPAALPTGRREILVCTQCADLGCGCVSADIAIEGDTLIWRDLGYENDYDVDSLKLFRMGAIRFWKTDFEHAIRSVVAVSDGGGAQDRDRG
jgi:hypothetical protein